jgi:CheY-like chemotaxis protein
MSDVKHRVLIVEDDDRIVEVVAACVESLGHVWERAATQADAQALLASKRFCYVLLDLEIPFKANSFSRIQNGENLLEYIAAMKPDCSSKVIVMTSHGNKGHDLAVQMMKKGAIDYVGKPLPPPGQTLDDKIKEALKKLCRHAPSECPVLAGDAASKPEPPSTESTGLVPFRGGKLVFHPNRVELLGHTILTAKGGRRSRPLLELLAEKKPDGSYIAYDGDKLAARLGQQKGQNDVAGYVKSLRRKIRETLRSTGVSCGDQDVIMSGGTGYRLNPWIKVEAHDG